MRRFFSVSLLTFALFQIPQSLSKPDGYDHRDALFGTPPYGGSIMQQVYYADSDLCDVNVDKRKGYPARPKDPTTGQMAEWESPYILMVDRGTCTFVQKVRNAQRAGAAAVLIADNTCLCNDTDCLSKTGVERSHCEPQEPIMADDGSGSDVSIPSFLMFKHDADAIKDAVTLGNQVRVEMKFAVPAPDSRVEYDLWTTPKDVLSRKFLQSFQDAAEALDKDAFFTPHMYVFDGVKAGCQNASGANECMTLCTNQGKYCANDPDHDLATGVSGADVVTESLRSLCIWNIYGADGIGSQWWAYANIFSETCDQEVTASKFNDPACVKLVMKLAGVDESAVSKCVKDSGGLEGNIRNKIFDDQLILKDSMGVFMLPSLYVNKAPIRGELSFETTFKAICAGYSTGSEPEICKICSDCHEMETCVEAESCTTDGVSTGYRAESGQGVSKGTFMMSLFMIAGLFGGLGAWQYKCRQHEMRDQVRGILADYLPLQDQDASPVMGDSMDFARGGVGTSLMT